MVLTHDDGETRRDIRMLSTDDLPEGDVLVRVDYSSLNYKDALAVTGAGPVIRNWPMVPGIDLAGTVEESSSPDYMPGDGVVLTGWGMGERHWGGYAQRQRVRHEWLLPLPEGLDAKRAMAIGTAGLTAMLCVMALEEAGLEPEKGIVLVTGASGGVGSVAISVLSHLGYEVAALTRSRDEEAYGYLDSLGASEVVVADPGWGEPLRPLEKQRWAGAVDTVGSRVLARVLAQTSYGGAVAACGLAGGTYLPVTVMPFVLRGVSLLGVDSVMCPSAHRREAWKRLSQELSEETLDRVSRTIPLREVPREAELMVAGQGRGRVVVNPNA
jgi:acrylyl-CoA reductase (NADPH)